MKKLIFSLCALMLGIGLAWADGVKVSGTVTASGQENPSFTNPTAMLLDEQGAIAKYVEVSCNYDYQTTKSTCTYEITEVAAGTYTLRVMASIYENGKSVLYSKTGSLTVESTDITEDIELEEDGAHVMMRVQPQQMVMRYGYLQSDALRGVEISCQAKESSAVVKITTSENPSTNPAVAFYCDTLNTYVVTLKKAGYKDTVHETKAWVASPYYPYEKQAASLSIVMQEDWGEEVTLSGSVTFGNFDIANVTLTERLQLVCNLNGTTKTLYSNIVNGQYSFTNVPKTAADTLYVVEDVANSYGSTTTQVSGLLQIKTPAKGVLDLSSATETATQNIELERIGLRVMGFVKDSVTGNGLGNVKVKIGNDSTTTVNYVGYGSTQHIGDFVFNTITETHLVVEFTMPGKGTVTMDTTVSFDAAGITGIVMLDTVEMAPRASEYTLSGKAGMRSSNGPNRPMKGVAVEMWSMVMVEGQGYVKDEFLKRDTTNDAGVWTLTYTGFAEDMVMFIATHDSLEQTQTYGSVGGMVQGMQNGSLDLYGESKYPLLIEMERVKARQDFEAEIPTVNLTWEWPAELLENYDTNGQGIYSISSIVIYRQTKEEQSSEQQVGYISLNYKEMPVTSFVDSATQYALEIGKTYTYRLQVGYTKPRYKTVTVEDPNNLTVKLLAEEPQYYSLTLNVNDETMGSVTGAGEEYAEGTEVTINAIANDGYEFVAWMRGNDTVVKTAEHKVVMTQNDTLTAMFKVQETPVVVKDSFNLVLKVDTTMGKVEGAGRYEENTEVTIKATANQGYSFVAWMRGNDTVAKTAEHKVVMTQNDTLTAVFVKQTGTSNEDREQAAWSVVVENQTIVLRSADACQYDVYTMAGALVKHAKTNANEYRIAVNNSGLYIIRRISATGYSVKKVVVR